MEKYSNKYCLSLLVDNEECDFHINEIKESKLVDLNVVIKGNNFVSSFNKETTPDVDSHIKEFSDLILKIYF